MRLTSRHTERPSHPDSWFLWPAIQSFTWCTDLEIRWEHHTDICVAIALCWMGSFYLLRAVGAQSLSSWCAFVWGWEQRVVLCNLPPPRQYSGKMSISYSHAATSTLKPSSPEKRNRPFITLDNTSVCSGQTLKYL